jgi:3-hydroxy-9,10-secoandrosta-1,3,5(10)-triene-9,17-dione monooxygenase
MQVDREEIRRRIAAISPALAERARASDEARRLDPTNLRAMIDAGMFRVVQPHRAGGFELPLGTLAEAVTGLSIACPSSGWVLMVMGAHTWCMGSFSEAAQDEVFGSGEALIAGTLSWQGTARACDGGWRVDGRWQFCSGVDHGNWVMMGCADANTRGPCVHVVVPKSEIEVDDTWHVLGLRGTGSKDILAHDVFVPASRAVDTRLLFRGESPSAMTHPTGLYRVPAEAMLSTSVANAVLGSAKFALDSFVERTKQRTVILTGARKSEHAPTQVRVAEAYAELRSAELMLKDVLDEFDAVYRGEPAAADLRVRAKWHAAYAAEVCRRAAQRIMSGSGAHSVYESSAIQQAFRNINVGAQHASIDFDTSAEVFARRLLGLGS